MAFKVIFLLTLGCLAASAAVLEHDGDDGPLSNNCIKAIFEVINSFSENPFNIHLDYWRTAHGVKVNEGVNAYNECFKNHWCSVRTVQEYMSKSLPLCVRRKPNTDAYRSVCESALILHLEGPAQCQLSSNDGDLKTYREQLLASLNRLTEAFLKEGGPEENGDVTTVPPTELKDFELQDQFAETQLTDDSIQENKLNFNILELLNENEMDLHASPGTPEKY